ncbi:hypothetical protein [Enterococcus sp. BWR-S5]|uniref:hypothetical protein n=1 Tax=Enterococcus sp. BWR-S5 TaxID=2787714 RepID=UPI001921E037|nr:hypothetical protein [Enterococcus sp. BWR-S5]MBL1224803.1 hypothetical protein [Enterococcus sp. BWR-S5]
MMKYIQVNIPDIPNSNNKIFGIIKTKKVRRKHMNPQENEQLVQLAVSVGEVAIRNSAATVMSKIRAFKERKDDKATISQMEEIINDLLADKSELLLAIKVYEEEFVAQKITEEDMEYITKNVIPALKNLASTMENEQAQKYLESIDTLSSSLLTTDVLKTLQILGFNFKQGIGSPLTTKLKNLILGSEMEQNNPGLATAIAARDIELYKVLQDEDAYERLLEIRNPNN